MDQMKRKKAKYFDKYKRVVSYYDGMQGMMKEVT